MKFKSFFLIATLGCCSFTACGNNNEPNSTTTNTSTQKPDTNTLCFYYNWYGIPEFDGKIYHWAHNILPQSSDGVSPGRIPGTGNNIASNYFPEAGIYSSKDQITIRRQMTEMAEAKIGVVVLTWWKSSDVGTESIPIIFSEAARAGLKVCFHIEPYGGRTASSVKEDMAKLIKTYGEYASFYRINGKPVFFCYDSYTISSDDWAEVLNPQGNNTIRGTSSDAIVIGLLLNLSDREVIKTSGFDGFYTYFAATGFTDGSTPDNWNTLQQWSTENNMIFIPCVGPGYIDTRIRPWNVSCTRDRENGAYYDRMFTKAIDSKASFIAITSFNEWHEGTQIEPAIPKTSDDNNFTYLNFLPKAPNFYITKTAELVEKFVTSRKKD